MGAGAPSTSSNSNWAISNWTVWIKQFNVCLMNFRGKHIKRSRALGCLLVAALLIQLFTQLHVHLRHTDSPPSHGHEHVIDFHVLTDGHAVEHATGDGTHELESTPDALVKKSLDRDSGLVLAFGLIILLPLLASVGSRLWTLPQNISLHKLYYGLAPPLRAPPAY
jgi:hypothetical protein